VKNYQFCCSTPARRRGDRQAGVMQLKSEMFHLMQRHFSYILRFVAVCGIFAVSQKKRSHFHFRHNFAICSDIFAIFEASCSGKKNYALSARKDEK